MMENAHHSNEQYSSVLSLPIVFGYDMTCSRLVALFAIKSLKEIFNGKIDSKLLMLAGPLYERPPGIYRFFRQYCVRIRSFEKIQPIMLCAFRCHIDERQPAKRRYASSKCAVGTHTQRLDSAKERDVNSVINFIFMFYMQRKSHWEIQAASNKTVWYHTSIGTGTGAICNGVGENEYEKHRKKER